MEEGFYKLITWNHLGESLLLIQHTSIYAEVNNRFYILFIIRGNIAQLEIYQAIV